MEGKRRHVAIDRDILLEKYDLLDAMASANRLHILTLLVEEEISVGKLAERVGMSQSALSQHLAKLRSGGFVTTRRQAQTTFYRCKNDRVIQVLALLKNFFGN